MAKPNQKYNTMSEGNFSAGNAFIQSAASAAFLQQQVALTQMQSELSSYPMEDIHHPGLNDVMCGRGGGTNNHIGNVRFRQLVNGHKLRYLAATKVEKPMVAREVVQIWRNLTPPGRFLAQDKRQGDNAYWNDIGNKKAREKASQCLRERTADVIPFVKQLELHQKLLDKEKGVGDDKNNDEDLGNQSAAELSQRLLQQQQAAAVAAHINLQANIPPTLLTSMNRPEEQSQQPRDQLSPEHLMHLSSQQIDNQTMTMMLLQSNMQTLSQAQLNNQMRLVTDEVPSSNTINLNPNKNSTKQMVRDDYANAVPPAAELLNEMDDGNGLSMEEYQKEIEDFLGASGGVSTQNKETYNNHCSKLTLDSEMMDMLKWDKSNSSIGSISLNSSLVMDVDAAFLRSNNNLSEPDPVTSRGESKHNSSSKGPESSMSHVVKSEMSDRTSLTLDSVAFKSLMRGNDSSSRYFDNDNDICDKRAMPPPLRVSQMPSLTSSMCRPSLTPGSGKTKSSSKANSTRSNMSDMSDFSSKRGSSKDFKFSIQRGHRSDISMASEMTDLSETMNSMDMKN
jgi:hypothetical protein